MNRRTPIQGDASLQVYPNLSEAAEMLGVSASTLSRRDDLAAEPRGERDRVVPAAEVLRLAAIYRRRSLNDTAQSLLEFAEKASKDEARRVEQEIDAFFERRVNSEAAADELLDLARRLLPASLVDEIEKALGAPGEDLPDIIQGWHLQPPS